MQESERSECIGIIIPVHNRKHVTLRCLESLSGLDAGGLQKHIIVVDDGSTDGTSEAVETRFPHVKVIHGKGDLWWTGAINRGVEYALEKGYGKLLFLNDDITFDREFLARLVAVSKVEPEALLSSIKLYKGLRGDAEVVAGCLLVQGMLHKIIDPSAGKEYESLNLDAVMGCDLLTGAALLVPAHVVNRIGLLDETRFPHNWGDFEFTRRAKLLGFKCLVIPGSRIYTDRNNPNYHNNYLINSPRSLYLKNLFDNHKYNYGFVRIWHTSMMHKPTYIGLLLAAKRILGAVRWLILKMILPTSVLARIAGVRSDS